MRFLVVVLSCMSLSFATSLGQDSVPSTTSLKYCSRTKRSQTSSTPVPFKSWSATSSSPAPFKSWSATSSLSSPSSTSSNICQPSTSTATITTTVTDTETATCSTNPPAITTITPSPTVTVTNTVDTTVTNIINATITNTITNTINITITNTATTATTTTPIIANTCIPAAAATTLANVYASFYTNYNAATADLYLADDFTETSNSINMLAGYPLDGYTYASKAAFKSGQGSEPSIPYNIIAIDVIDCLTVAFRWSTNVVPNGLLVKGVNDMRVSNTGSAAAPWQISTMYTEFNAWAWAKNVGLA